MSGGRETLAARMKAGASTVCRAWAIVRGDGVTLGFTDHDQPLEFGGTVFRADAGLSARAVAQSTGLSVDNTEAAGLLSADAITEEDILAGRYDGAEVTEWLVDWTDPAARTVVFAGNLGEVVRDGGAFRADLRGRTETLNRPTGRIYQTGCAAVLGDASCGVDLDAPGLSVEAEITVVEAGRIFWIAGAEGHARRWFERGRAQILSGRAAGLIGAIKEDRAEGILRRIELWEEIRAEVSPGDRLRVEAGCDKRDTTCIGKFDNFVNYRGFPHVPGEDWLTSYPKRKGGNHGGSRAGRRVAEDIKAAFEAARDRY
ncbi:DUF2163 domain-containing protein [Tropicimonas sp. IMCC34011]|uniref:DUF2163 domain-containing protein n=1 Tax=Tropicimonas sp. IMCC34011 TaxID=2248759 RepID=UPI0018E5A4E4|nr:DUF2163 domain-containing protein [Tropicimonas sp. IMCC34011]